MNKLKLKDLKYQIQGVESDKPLKECLSAIFLGMLVPILIAVIVRFASELDTLWNIE